MSDNNGKIEARGMSMIIVAWIAVFLVNLAIFALGMFLPSMREEMGFGVEVSGMLSAISWITKALVTIPIALVVTRYSPKYVLGFTYILMGGALLLQAFSSSVELIFLGRALVAVSSAAIAAPLVPVKIDWIPKDKMANVNGVENFIGPAGQSLATFAIGALMSMLGGWRNIMIVLGVTGLILGVVWIIIYREKSGIVKSAKKPFLEPLKEALKEKTVWLLALGWPGTSLVWIATYTFWPTYAQETLGLSVEQSGMVLGLLPIASAIASLVSPIIAKKIGVDKPLIWMWGFILPFAYFSMLITSNIVLLSIASFVAGFGAYAFVPLAMTTLYKLPKLSANGTTLGVSCILTMVGVGGALGGFLAGKLAAIYDLKTAMMICCLSPFLFGILTLFMPEMGRKAMEKQQLEKQQADS